MESEVGKFLDTMMKAAGASQDADDETSIGVGVEIVKVLDEPQRYFLGWASVSSVDGVPVTDRQGDIITDAELEAAANAFMPQARVGKIMHTGGEAIDYTQSLVITPEVKKALGIEGMSKCGWLVGGFCRDLATWERVKSGELGSLSIGGTGTRTPVVAVEKHLVEVQSIRKASDTMSGFRKALSKLTGVRIAEVSAVDRPANQHAHIVLAKAAATATQSRLQSSIDQMLDPQRRVAKAGSRLRASIDRQEVAKGGKSGLRASIDRSIIRSAA
jgi:hypothetical protein